MPASTEIEIEVESRWDAVALMHRLDPYHAYLIQHAPTHWVVHAGCPGYHGEQLPSALVEIEQLLDSRQVEGAAVRIGGRPHTRLSGRRSRPSLAPASAEATRVKRAPTPVGEQVQVG